MRRDGFTLMETILTVALIAVLLSAGGIVTGQYLRGRVVRSAGEIVTSQARQAQAEAHGALADAAHGIKVFPGYVVRFQGATYASRTASADVRTDFPASVTLSGSDEMAFAAASAFPYSAVTVTVANADLAEDVAVTAYGLITVTERTISH